jgi:Ca2+/Na+ antiporter
MKIHETETASYHTAKKDHTGSFHAYVSIIGLLCISTYYLWPLMVYLVTSGIILFCFYYVIKIRLIRNAKKESTAKIIRERNDMDEDHILLRCSVSTETTSL